MNHVVLKEPHPWELRQPPKLEVAECLDLDESQRMYRLRVKNREAETVRLRAKLTEIDEPSSTIPKSQLPFVLEWTHHPDQEILELEPGDSGRTISVLKLEPGHYEGTRNMRIWGV